MSLILEALKKSEQQRRLGEAPTLGSPALASRPRRSVLPLLFALVVAALGIGWWLLRAPAIDAGAPAVASSNADATKAPPAAPHPTPAPNLKPVQPNPTTSRPPAAATPAATAPVPATAAADRRDATTKHVTMPLGDRPGSVAQLPPALPMVAGPTPAATPAAPAARPVVATPVAPVAKAPAPPLAAPAKSPAAATAPAPVSPPPPAEAVARKKPEEPALPSVWELPYGTRKDLPELSLTMHVYSDDPHGRFVVIKGTRHVEGDDLGDGVTLQEIRPDGLVLEAKGKRFTYPRDGR